jgi:hypothetical protein
MGGQIAANGRSSVAIADDVAVGDRRQDGSTGGNAFRSPRRALEINTWLSTRAHRIADAIANAMADASLNLSALRNLQGPPIVGSRSIVARAI